MNGAAPIGNWLLHFAWRPVRLYNGGWRWLCHVERCVTGNR